MKTPLLILFMAVLGSAMAQEAPADPYASLNRECNSPRPGDSFTMSEIHALPPGGRGTARVWHLPDADGTDHRRTYLSKGDTTVCLEYPEYLTYSAVTDTVRLTSAENREMKVSYDLAPPLLRLPMAYGDSISSPTSGTGIFGKRLYIGHRGTAYSVADGTGMLTDGTDTLRHVLRVYTRHEYRRVMDPDTARVSAWMSLPALPDSLPLFIDERHSWYAAGSRYPVMERVASMMVYGGDTVMTRAVTLLCLPELQRTDLGDDTPNSALLARITAAESGQRDGPTPDADSPGGFPATVDAVLGADGRTVNVTYTLDTAADVRLGVFDALGRALCSVTRESAAPGTHSECLALTSPPSGNALLTVWVGDDNMTFKVRTE